MELSKTIFIDWNNKNSIKRAENSKVRAENNGYKLILTVGGLNTSQLIFKKIL